MPRRIVHFNSRDLRETSPEDPRYNCIAWAAGDTERFWWCVDSPFVYWPATAPKECTIAAFVAAFQTLGYEECDNGELEEGFSRLRKKQALRPPILDSGRMKR